MDNAIRRVSVVARAVATTTALAVASFMLSAPAGAAAPGAKGEDGTPSGSATTQQFLDKILNGVCCVPNLSSGYRGVLMKNGVNITKDGDRTIECTIDKKEVVFGTLDNRPVAVAVLSDAEGGSGIFQSLLLYEMRDGKAVTVGAEGFGDRTTVEKLKISDNKVVLSYRVNIGNDAGKRYTKSFARKDFDVAECMMLDQLAEATRKDLKELSTIWQLVLSNEALSAEQKEQARAICLRHADDKKAFADAFRMTLSAEGWGPGPQPLSYDANGKPILRADDNVSDVHNKVEL